MKLSKIDKSLLIFALLGVVICAISLFRGILEDRQVQVEYIKRGNTANNEKIWVDVEGAVMKPGPYELFDGQRIKDALIAAGGLSAKADRNFCEKTINLAEVMKDGGKIYIPYIDGNTTEGGYIEKTTEAKTINVNTATRVELDTLWGVGETRVDSIVKNRPYKNTEELVEKGVLTKTIMDKNKGVLSVY